MKPLLADDYIESKLVFPIIGQPKIDGVRALNMTGPFTGRSLKKFKNQYVTTRYSHSALVGLDGEAACESHVHPALCRITSSKLGTIKGEPFMLWWLFDYVTIESKSLPYGTRLDMLRERFNQLQTEAPDLWQNLRLFPWRMLHSLEELEAYDAENLEAGYEGTILRDPNAAHKEGRSGAKPILWRIKRFVDFEFVIDEVEEGEQNTNEAKLNELGHTERSTHQDNMIPNGMVGALLGRTVAVVKDGQRVLFEAGRPVRIGAGCMTHDERKHYFENQNEIIGRIGKAKFFPKGIKDKLRFPTFQSFREAADMDG
jgi:DNA ligase 1